MRKVFLYVFVTGSLLMAACRPDGQSPDPNLTVPVTLTEVTSTPPASPPASTFATDSAFSSPTETPTVMVMPALSGTLEPSPRPKPSPEPTLTESASVQQPLEQLGKGMVTGIDISPGGDELAASSPFGVYFYTTQTFEQAGFLPTEKPASGLKFSPDGRRVAIMGDSIWILDRGEPAHSLVLHPSSGGKFSSLAWSPDGKMLVSGSQDGAVVKWDSLSGEQIRQLQGSISSPATPFAEVGWSARGCWDGSCIVAHTLGTIHVWDAASGQEMNQFSVKKGQTGGMTISPNPERNWLALNSISDPQVDLWDWRSGQPLRFLKVTPPNGGAYSPTWSPDGRLFAASGKDQTLLFDVQTGKQVQYLKGAFSPVNTVTWLSDGTYLAEGLVDGKVRVWRTDSWGVPDILDGQRDQLSALAWAPDSRLLAAASLNGTILIWDLSHDEQ